MDAYANIVHLDDTPCCVKQPYAPLGNRGSVMACDNMFYALNKDSLFFTSSVVSQHLLNGPSTPAAPIPSTTLAVSLKGTRSGVLRNMPCSNAMPRSMWTTCGAIILLVLFYNIFLLQSYFSFVCIMLGLILYFSYISQELLLHDSCLYNTGIRTDKRGHILMQCRKTGSKV